MSSADFDWNDDECVIVREQKAVAVYTNTKGAIVIRDQGDYFAHEEDTWIVLQPDRAVAVAKAILALADELGAIVPPGPALALPAPTDRTAADRQRRHRERKRNGDTVTVTQAVTPCSRNGVLFPD